MIRYIILFFLLLSSNFLFAIDYRSTLTLGESRKLTYENSNFIFTGIPQSIDSNIVKFSVIECFKGIIGNETIVKFYLSPSEENIFSLWLIYGNLKEDTIFSDSPLSRSVDNSYIIGVSKRPTLIIDESNSEYVRFEEDPIEKALLENQWRNEFYDEIMILRCLKEKEFSDIIPTKDYTNYLIILNFLMSGLAIVLLLVLLKSKKLQLRR